MRSAISKIPAFAALLILTTACSSSTPPPAQNKPIPGSLARVFDLIDKADGRPYGTVEMDPIGGGRVLDGSGRLIGTIVPPAH